jgi:hypothetical protein
MEPGTYTLSSVINENNLHLPADLEPVHEEENPMYVPPLGELTDTDHPRPASYPDTYIF